MADRSFGEFVRKLRIVKGVRLRNAARSLGISPSYLSQIEQNQTSPPRIPIMEKIAQYYGIATERLLLVAPNRRHTELLRNYPNAQSTTERVAFYRITKEIKKEDLLNLLLQAYHIQGKTEVDMQADLDKLREDLEVSGSEEESLQENNEMHTGSNEKEPQGINRHKNRKDSLELFEIPICPRHLSRASIENKAMNILCHFGLSPLDYRPPTPIEDIVETPGVINIVLKEKLSYNQMECEGKIWGVSSWSNKHPGERDIFVDAHVFESEDPDIRARLNFTLAHEYFHTIEHLPLAISQTEVKNTNLLFNQWKTGDGLKTAMPTPRKPKPKLLTAHGIMPERFQTSEHWREWQANHFAACILIPRFSLLREFEERFGTIQLAHPISKKKEAYAKEVARMNRPDNFGDTRSLSELYCVSNTAMAIRLTDLELIV